MRSFPNFGTRMLDFRHFPQYENWQLGHECSLVRSPNFELQPVHDIGDRSLRAIARPQQMNHPA